MSADKDNSNRNGPSDGNAPGGINLSSYLKEKTPTMARILQEEEARTAALAAGNGGGDDVDLEFAEAEEEPAETADDPFMIVEEESFDLSFDNLDEDDLADETADFEGDLGDLDLEAGAIETAEAPELMRPDDGPSGGDGEEGEDDLGPPLTDPSAPPDDGDDLSDIEFVDDATEAPDEPNTTLSDAPEHSEPLSLAEFDDERDSEVDDGPDQQSADVAETDTADIARTDAAHGDGEDGSTDGQTRPDEFADWNDRDTEEAEDDLGPPLPDPSAPELPKSEQDAGAHHDDAEEEELTLEIEGLEFRPGDTIDEADTVVVNRDEDTGGADEPASKPSPDTHDAPNDDTAPDPAPGLAEPAKPVSVQEALLAAIELHRVGDLEGAAHGYEMLVRRYPNSAAGWINLGIVLRRMGKLDASLVCLRRGVMLNPKDGAAWSNLGNALRAANYLEDAKRAQIKAISLTPGAAQIHYNMGLVTRDFGELIEADSCFRRADLLGYKNPDLAWDRSLNLLLSGNLEEGFAAYEARWNLPDTQQRYADLPRWQGDMQKDKTIVIHAEQGLGDSLQFCRYVPTLKSRVGRLIFEVQPQLVDLLTASPWFRGVDIHAREQASVAADMQMPLLSTPILLPLGESVLPGRDPYLTPPAGGPRIREILPNPRIGIAWAGKPTHKNDANRSAGLSAFTALFDVLNTRFYSLQVGPAQSQIRNLALNSVVQDLSPAIRSFADTASLLQDIDLVITVDTSVAHLAGAMGKQVWVVLPFSPDWRWQLRRQDSPWYPTMRLFRQTSPGDWDGVFMKVRGALDEWLDARDKAQKN